MDTSSPADGDAAAPLRCAGQDGYSDRISRVRGAPRINRNDPPMTTRRLGIILNGVSGRIGSNQHLPHGIVAHRQNPIRLRNGDEVLLDPIVVSRDVERARECARRFGIERWSADLDAVLSDTAYSLFFDAAITRLRGGNVRKALLAGKDVLCDKPLAATHAEALELMQLAQSRAARNGVMMTHLWLPGMRKLQALKDAGFFGRVLLIKGEHGYWVFEGDAHRPGQRPSWNNRKEEGGGIVLDMMCHWHYLLETLFGRVRRVTCAARVAIPARRDEANRPYDVTAEDTAMVICELADGTLAQICLTWCTRVRRDELMALQVDGSHGSAVAGIIDCYTQHRDQTPAVVWSADTRTGVDHRQSWLATPDLPAGGNPFKIHWEAFIRHVMEDAPFPWDFARAARGLELVDLCYRSAEQGTWESMRS